MSIERVTIQRVGLATAIPRGRGMLVPISGTGGGGEFGADILDEDRTFAITREPVAHRIVFTVAHDIFDNWFELELKDEENEEKSEAFNEKAQRAFDAVKLKQELTRMAVFERAYGYAIIVLGYIDTATNLMEASENPSGLKEIKAYSPTQISKIDTVKDKMNPRYGLPEYYHIKREGIAANLKIHYTRVVHFANRLIASDYKGMSVLDPVWDDLVTLRNIRWGMGQTMYRTGAGFFDITFTGADKDAIDSWVDTGVFSNLSERTFFAHNEAQTLDIKGFEGKALNPMNYYMPIMENISAGSGIPLAILRGVQAGALTGSEVNQMEYYGLISDEQSGYEPQIRQLIDVILKFNGNQNPPEYTFNWKGGFELDEQKKAEIERTKAETREIEGNWKTRNEIRQEENPDLPELSEEQGGNELLTKQGGGQGFDYQVREIPKTRQPNPSPQSR